MSVRGRYSSGKGSRRCLHVIAEALESRRLFATVFVDANATGQNNGTSWASAYQSLGTALTAAAAGGAGTVVKVAKGTYIPSGASGDRTVSFAIPSGVSLLGGYPGATAPDPEARNITLNPTILSGDIGVAGVNTDNAYHVLQISGAATGTVLDGFTITLAYADGSALNQTTGGGAIILSSSVAIDNCTFTANAAPNGFGAGVAQLQSTVVYTASTFVANTLADRGGGVYALGGTATFVASDLSGNSVVSRGGGFSGEQTTATFRNSTIVANKLTGGQNLSSGAGLYIGQGTLTLASSTVTKNSGPTSSGALTVAADASATITNTIFWSHPGGDVNGSGTIAATSSLVSGLSGTGNKTGDPRFLRNATVNGPTDYGDLRLASTSPALDTGSNAAVVGLTTDRAGNARISNTTVDIGAFEGSNTLPADTRAPAATLVAPPVVTYGALTSVFQVEFTDDRQLTTASAYTSTAVRVTGPNGFSSFATFSFGTGGADATPALVSYLINAPGGSWNAADNGVYTLSVAPNAVSDSAGNFAPAATLGQVTVNIVDPSDTTLPTAALGPLTPPTFGQTSFTFTVVYSDNVAINTSTFDVQDISVAADGVFRTTVQFVSATGNTATYRFTPKGGTWDSGDSGVYAFTVVADQVIDTAGNRVPTGVIGTLNVTVIDPPDSTPPTAVLVATPVPSPGDTSFSVSVAYADNLQVNGTTITAADIRVTGPNNYSRTATTRFFGLDNTAQYGFQAPGGSWDASDNGTYTVSIQAGEVTDLAGNAVLAGSLGTFVVSIGVPDTLPPTATLEPLATPAFGETQYSFSVRYTDPAGFDNNSLGTGDVRIALGTFSTLPEFVSLTPAAGGAIATYRFVPPDGSWDAEDNGSYAITLVASEVKDISGNFAPAQSLGTLTVSVSDPVIPDTTPPTATLGTLLPPVFGQTVYSFTITYADNVAIDATTVGTGDVSVTGLEGFTATPQLVTFASGTATYQFTPPSGSWNSEDNAQYTLSLLSTQVADLTGNFIPATLLGSLTVDIMDPPPPDTTPPTATLGTLAPAVIGQTLYAFSVTYADDESLNAATLGSTDITITGPSSFTAPATFVSFVAGTATYQFTPPGGSWTTSDNGPYTLSLAPNQVADTAGNFAAAGPLGQLTVALTEPPTPDTTAPTATLGSLTPAAFGDQTYTFAVTYTDDIAPDLSSANTGDVLVTGPAGFAQIAEFISSNGSTASYRFTPPGGSWNAADNGTYTLSLAPNQITDTSGNFALAGPLGTLTVAITDPDTTPPSATLATLTPPNFGDSAFPFQVTFADNTSLNPSTIGSGDITITGPNSFSQIAELLTLTGLTATYRITPPGGTWDTADNGLYTIFLGSNQVSDAAGNFAPAATLGTFTAALTAPDTTLLVEAGNLNAASPDLVLSQLKLATIKRVLGSVVGGTLVKGTLAVQNLGSSMATGAVSVGLFLSSDSTPSTADLPLTTLQVPSLKLRPKASKTVSFTIEIPRTLSGDRTIIALVNPTGTSPEASTLNNARATTALPIAQPFINFSATKLKAAPAKAGKTATATVLLTNASNAPFNSSIPVTLSYLSNGVTTPLASLTTALKLAPNGTRTLTLRYTVPATATGSDGKLIFNIDPTTTLGESLLTDNTAEATLTVRP